MKIRISHILFIVALFFAADGYSQVDRRIGPSQYVRTTKKNKNKKKPDFTEDALAYLAAKLKLDDFQKAAMREIIAKYKDSAKALMDDKEMRAQEKREKSYAISYKIYEESAPLLSKEQIETYQQILKIEKKADEEAATEE